MNILSSCPIYLHDLKRLTDYVIKWNWILDEKEDEFSVLKWYSENKNINEVSLINWLEELCVHNNKEFINIVGRVVLEYT